MDTTPRHDDWKGTTGGTTWMQQKLIAFLGWINLPFAYSLMALVIPFYMIFNHKGYLAQYHFFRRRMRHGVMQSFWHVYLNHFTFGQIILDRFATYGGAKFNVEIEGNEVFLSKISQPEGFIQLSSHIGNFELAGYMLSQDQKPINALIFGGETNTVMQNRQRIFEHTNISLIPVGTDMAHVYAMNNALEQGEIVSMPGDRVFGSQKSITCDFLGSKAEFPMGPFILAATREVPVLSIFVMKKSTRDYQIYVREVALPADCTATSARARSAALAQEFARQLEAVVKQYPNQWFNYYEFWKD